MDKSYYKEKLQLLKDFSIPITATIEAHLLRCTSEIQMDNYCHDLIIHHLDK